MKRILLLLVTLLSIYACKNNTETASQEKSVYYFIRHAEKDTSNPEDTNPELTYYGEERAKGWAKYFDSIPLDKIYSTTYKRTMETALPIAAKKFMKLETYKPDELINPNFFLMTKGKQVLIVGHSNTTPFLVNTLLEEDQYANMPDDDFSTLYKVTLVNGKATAEVISVNP